MAGEGTGPGREWSSWDGGWAVAGDGAEKDDRAWWNDEGATVAEAILWLSDGESGPVVNLLTDKING